MRGDEGDDLVLGPVAAREVEGVDELEAGGLGGGEGIDDAVDLVVAEGDVEDWMKRKRSCKRYCRNGPTEPIDADGLSR